MEQQLIKGNFIIVTGAESTGKTQLVNELATHYNCNRVPELARNHIEQLGRAYTFADVEYIAQMQIDSITIAIKNNEKVIFDTGLIITKVWFEIVYQKCPAPVIEFIEQMPKVFHLLCDTDIPWVADSVRENGGEMRLKLNQLYEKNLQQYGFPYAKVTGKETQRLRNAIAILEKMGFN